MSGAQSNPSIQSEICPYSFVPIENSLTPKLSARTRVALLNARPGTLIPPSKISSKRTKIAAKDLWAVFDISKHFAAVKVTNDPGPKGSLLAISEYEARLNRNNRIRLGMIVGDLASDPRFATREMWETGTISEKDRETIYARMAWLAEFGEEEFERRSPVFAHIQVADFRSRNILLDVWEELDTYILQAPSSAQVSAKIITHNLGKNGSPPPATHTPKPSADPEAEGTIKKAWPPILTPIFVAGFVFAAAFSVYEMYLNAPKPAITSAAAGSGSGSADESSAATASGSAEENGAPAASGSAEEYGAEATSGSADEPSAGGGVEQPGSINETAAVVQPEASQTTKRAATIEEVCEILKNKVLISKTFNKAQCPQGNPSPGCSVERTLSGCTVTIDQ